MEVEYKEEKPLLLVFPFGLMSHYLRCLKLAKSFRPYFQVLFAFNEKFESFVTEEGFQTFFCRSLDAERVLKGVNGFDFSWLNESFLEPAYHDQVRAIRHLKPAAVLGDTAVTLKMAAEKTGVPYISLMNGYMSKYYSLTRKISRTHPMHRFIKNLPHIFADALTQKGEAVAFYSIHSAFKKIRRQQQLSSRKYYLDELEGDINLVCDLKELFPLKELPANYRQIAPLFHDAGAASLAAPAWLDPAKKTLFASMGSSGDWEKIRYLNHPVFDRYNVVTAGDTNGVLHAPHIISLPFVNVDGLFPHTDLVICHGGNGTIYQALSYAIPVLCSTSHFEQEWNVEAMQRLKLGQSLDEVEDAAECLKIIGQWLEKKERGLVPSYRKTIAAQVKALETVVEELAAEIIEPQVLRPGLRA